MLLQARDFLELKKRYGCSVQIGGSDQWGNITAGTELIRRSGAGEAFGVTGELILGSDGKKFGKSEGGALWMDPEMTTPYDLHQYFLNTADADAVRYLKIFTMLGRDDIEGIAEEQSTAPHKRVAQRRLADEVVSFLHGADALQAAVAAGRVLFGGSVEGMGRDVLMQVFRDVPSSTLAKSSLEEGLSAIDLATQSGLCSSRGEARRLIQGGGLSLNQDKLTDIDARVGTADLLDSGLLILRKGRKSYHLVSVE